MSRLLHFGVTLLSIVSVAEVIGAQLIWLPPLEGESDSAAFDVSANGEFIFGNSGDTPVIWDRQGNAIALQAPPGVMPTEFIGVSPDGLYAVGWGSRSGSEFNGNTLIRWSAIGPPLELIGPPAETGMLLSATAVDVSTNGRVVVGSYPFDARIVPARWTADDGWQSLAPSGVEGGGWSYAVSADGSAVAGDFNGEAFRWTDTTGFESLGDLPGGGPFSTAYAMSDNGQYVVGASHTDRGYEMFVWAEETGMQLVPGLPNDQPLPNRVPTGISDQGVIVGIEFSPSQTGFIVDPQDGLKYLDQIVNVSMREQIGYATKISADGSTVVGLGKGPYGHGAWVLSLNVPEPSGAMGVACILLLGLGVFRGKRRQ